MFFNDLPCRFYNVCYYNLSLWEILKNQSLNEDVKIDILKEINEIKYTLKLNYVSLFLKIVLNILNWIQYIFPLLKIKRYLILKHKNLNNVAYWLIYIKFNQYA